ESGAKKTYVSFEPLLMPVDPDGTLDLTGIDLAIVGGESGRIKRQPGAEADEESDDSRPEESAEARLSRRTGPVRMEKAWVAEIQEACRRSGTAFFFKQWGRYDEAGEPVGKTKSGRVLDGQTWDEQPAWNDEFMREAGLLAAYERDRPPRD